MEHNDSQLRDLLVELENLRSRDERLRRNSDAIAAALQALGELTDGRQGPALLLDHLGRALGVSDLALKCRQGGYADVLMSQAGTPFRALLADPDLLVYLEAKPTRALADPQALKAALGLGAPLEALSALISGRIQAGESRWLLLCAGTPRLLEPESRELVQRFLPLFAQSLQRLIEGQQAAELAQREREAALAREKAEAASRAKSEFVSRMSHELRTPLNAIIGFAQLLEDEPLTPGQRNSVQLIGRSGEHLLELINAVLDHAKIESGKLTLENIPFDLPPLIEAVTTMVTRQAQEKGLVFQTHLADDLPSRILGDPTRLRQVLINLLSNAIKFTHQGRVELRMTTEARRLHFSILDTGIGMDAAALAQLFQPYSQADQSITRKYGGTGLGLIIAKELLEAMGGGIEVESTPGAGSCFRCQVPFRQAPATPEVAGEMGAATPAGAMAGGGQSGMQGRRVLVVDDNAINRKVATIILERMGLVVDAAENGLEALERVAAVSYAAVLMDVEMPGLDGLGATRAIRDREARGNGPRLPIIAITANAMVGDQERCLAAGMDGYVAKPIVVAHLRQELQRVLGEG